MENAIAPRRAFKARSLLLWLAAGLLLVLYFYLNLVSLLGTTLTDFHIYYDAVGHAVRGEAVYDVSAPMPFLYPPFALIVFRPFAYLSEPAATTVWLIVLNGLLAISVGLLWATVRPVGAEAAAWIVILFAAFSPVMLNNLYGQSNPLILALVCIFVWGYSKVVIARSRSLATKQSRFRRRDCFVAKERLLAMTGCNGNGVLYSLYGLLAALALSIAISVRVLPVALLAVAGIQRRWRFVWMTLAFVAIEAIAAGAWMGWRTELHYFTTYMFQLRGHENMREISLLALCERLAPARVAMAMFGGCVAAGAALFAAFVLRPMGRREGPLAVQLALVIASMVLFAPLLEYHHYVLLLAPYALVLGHLWRTGKWSLASTLPVFSSWAIVSAANQLSHYRYAAVAFAALLGAALIWGYCLWLAREGSRRGENHVNDTPV